MPTKSGIDKLSSISSLSSNISARVAGSAGDDAGISEVKDRFVEHVDEQGAEEEGDRSFQRFALIKFAGAESFAEEGGAGVGNQHDGQSDGCNRFGKKQGTDNCRGKHIH